MEAFGVFILIVVAISLVIFIRLIAGGIDHDRIDEYISERGGRVIEKDWSPFGKGWFGSEHERIYELKYEDKDGNIHQATCKTSMLSGVYFTEDIIIQQSGKENNIDRQTQFELENQMLKKQIEELKRDKMH
jgi:hypothetical protein